MSNDKNDQAEYRREVAHWDLGYGDAEAGLPDRTAEMGSYADDYASGYESFGNPLAGTPKRARG